jgi:pimeloyl-ACP methyl ester carboxylesterase
MARSDAMLGLQSRWQCPVHGVWGEHDALYKGKLEALKDRLTGCDLQSFHIVPNAGHWVQYEQPDAFNQILRRCLPVPKP